MKLSFTVLHTRTSTLLGTKIGLLLRLHSNKRNVQPPPYQSKKFTSKGEDPKANKGSPQSSDDEAGEGESSSDWDDALIMEEDPLTFVVDHVDTIHSLSSDGDNEIESEPDTKSMARGEREMPKNKKEIDETPVTITGKPKVKL